MSEIKEKILDSLNDDKGKKKSKKKKGKFKFKFWIIIIVVLVVCGTLIYMTNPSLFIKEEPQLTIVSKSSLEKVLEISELSTVEYTYNGIATIKDKNKKGEEEIKYHVAYEGTIKAGINFSEITVEEVNEEEKTIVISLPDVEVFETDVTAGKLEYIFVDSKAETETVSSEAYNKCCEDLEKKAGKESALKQLGMENAKATVNALLKPWVNTVDSEYTIKIVDKEGGAI